MSVAIPEDCSRRRMAPAAAGDVGAAPFWYYVDNSGSQQGPFGTAHMHSWHAAGYLLPTTKVAASYYGEVPDEFWPLRKTTVALHAAAGATNWFRARKSEAKN